MVNLRPGHFTPAKKSRYPLNWRLGEPQNSVCTFWVTETSLAPTAIRTLDRSLVATPTVILWPLRRHIDWKIVTGVSEQLAAPFFMTVHPPTYKITPKRQ
jgi:hypothetical protein